MNINPKVRMIELRRKQEVERIVPDPVSHEVVAELRNELVVLTSPIDLTSWDDIAEEVKNLLIFKTILRSKSIVANEKKSSIRGEVFRGS